MSACDPKSDAEHRLNRILSHLTSQDQTQVQDNGRKKVVVCRDLGPDVMSLLYQRPELEIVTWPENRPCTRKWLLDNIPGATGLIVVLSEPVNEELLTLAGPTLQAVSTMSVGYEHVDLRAVASRGIKVGYTPDVLTDAVADLSVMLALMAGRNGGETISLVQDGQWPYHSWSPYGFCGPQLSTTAASQKRTIGFIGFGRIAQATLARLVPFGVTDCIYYSDPLSSADNSSRDANLLQKYGLKSLRRASLDELAKTSDIVFVLAPGGEKTKHIVNEDFLKQMKKTAILINSSRGTLVDSNALAKALREKWIWGAGVDVVEGEPNIGADHPLVKEPRCVVLPHIGSATLETRLGMATLAVKNLVAAIFGEPMPAELDIQSRI